MRVAAWSACWRRLASFRAARFVPVAWRRRARACARARPVLPWPSRVVAVATRCVSSCCVDEWPVNRECPTHELSFRCCSLALALVLLASAVSPAHTAPLDATRLTLKNGMRVVLAPDSLATAVDLAVWFASGSRHEAQPAQAGLALLAARLGFRNGASDPLAPLANEGGTGALVATPDLTSFSATVPPAHSRARSRSSPTACPATRSRQATLPPSGPRSRPNVRDPNAHPWRGRWRDCGHGVAGASVCEDGRGAVARRRRHHARERGRVAAGAFFVVVVDAHRGRRVRSGQRSGRDPRTLRITAARSGAGRAGSERARVAGRSLDRIEVPARLCLVGWRGPGAGDPDAPALEFLAAWLGAARGPRLSRSLVSDWHLAVAAQAGFTSQKDGSLLWAMLVVSPGAGLRGRRDRTDGCRAFAGEERARGVRTRTHPPWTRGGCTVCRADRTAALAGAGRGRNVGWRCQARGSPPGGVRDAHRWRPAACCGAGDDRCRSGRVWTLPIDSAGTR